MFKFLQKPNGLNLKLQLIEGKADYLKSVGWSPEHSSSQPASLATSLATTTTLATSTTLNRQQSNMIEKNGDIWSCIVCGKVASDPKTKV